MSHALSLVLSCLILVELLKPCVDLVAEYQEGVCVSVCVAGDDADLCSELLQESLDALRALPEATLFDEGTVSSVWLEVVERATKFLRSPFYPSSSHSPHRTSVLLVP